MDLDLPNLLQSVPMAIADSLEINMLVDQILMKNVNNLSQITIATTLQPLMYPQP